VDDLRTDYASPAAFRQFSHHHFIIRYGMGLFEKIIHASIRF
jgi:hypothetical protein